METALKTLIEALCLAESFVWERGQGTLVCVSVLSILLRTGFVVSVSKKDLGPKQLLSITVL